jgi:hypothetical protein
MSQKGLYFFAYFYQNFRSCTYSKQDVLRALKAAVLAIPEEFRPTLHACAAHKIFYINQPTFAGTDNDLLAVRHILEAAMRSVHPKSYYAFGFDSVDSKRPTQAYVFVENAIEAGSYIVDVNA